MVAGRTLAILLVIAGGIAGCSGDLGPDPVEEFSARIPLGGDRPATVTRTLAGGVYLVEARERDVDARITIAVEQTSSTLEDKLPRHGVVYQVVRLRERAALRVEARSVDHVTMRGQVIIRIRRFGHDVDAPPGELESGYEAQSIAAEISAAGKSDKWPLAAEKLHEAVSHFERAGDERARGEAAYMLAYVEYSPRDQYAAAVRACQSATEAFERADDDVGVQNAATLRAAAEIELASAMAADSHRDEKRALFAEADRRLAAAAVFFERHALPVRAEYAVNMRAVGAVAYGDYESGTRLLARAVEMARANADVRERTLALGNLASIHVYMGQMARAAREFEALMPLVDRNKQPYNYASLLANRGFVSIALGDFDRALALHDEAMGVFAQLGEEDERAAELSELGALYFRMGDNQRALETLKSAIDAQEKISDAAGLTASLRLAGNVASVLGQHEVALEYLKRAARINGDPHSVAHTNVLVAGELRQLGRLDQADSTLSGSLASVNPLVHASAIEERAHIRLARNQRAAAIEDLRAANAEFTALGLEMDRIDLNTALSRALLAAGDRRGAVESADEAIAIVGRVRSRSANPEWRARFLSARYSPYEARIAAELAGDEPLSSWRSFLIAEDVRARSLADELSVSGKPGLRTEAPEETALRTRLTSLQLRLELHLGEKRGDSEADRLLRRDIAESRARLDAIRARRGVVENQSLLPDSLEQVQSQLPPDTAVLSYFIGDVRGYAWLLTASEFRRSFLPGRESLERAVLDARREERSGSVGASGRRLARLLLGSLLDDTEATRLLILPDGPLNGVAFPALPLGADGSQLVVDRFVVASAPSLGLALRQQHRQQRRHQRVAVVSDPVYAADDRRLTGIRTGSADRGDRSASRELQRLRYSATEAQAVVRSFSDVQVIELAGFDASAQRVIELPSQDLGVLHFATHAVTRTDAPDQSALFLSEYAADGSTQAVDRLTAEDIARTGLRADTVVLSGCATGSGRELRGEGVLGLTYSFLANGSDTVVASLWPVEDALTARFMEEFYAAYRTTGRAPDALRTAQLKTRGTAAAAVWASFVVRANALP